MDPKFRKFTGRAALLAAVVGVAALAATPAFATAIAGDPGSIPTALNSDHPSTVVQSTYLQYGHAPDTNDQAAASQQTFLTNGHSPDTTVASVAQPTYVSYAHAPDTNDPALFAAPQVVAVSSDSFDWGDFGIGLGSALTAMLLLGGAVLIARQTQGRLRNA